MVGDDGGVAVLDVVPPMQIPRDRTWVARSRPFRCAKRRRRCRLMSKPQVSDGGALFVEVAVVEDN